MFKHRSPCRPLTFKPQNFLLGACGESGKGWSRDRRSNVSDDDPFNKGAELIPWKVHSGVEGGGGIAETKVI